MVARAHCNRPDDFGAGVVTSAPLAAGAGAVLAAAGGAALAAGESWPSSMPPGSISICARNSVSWKMTERGLS